MPPTLGREVVIPPDRGQTTLLLPSLTETSPRSHASTEAFLHDQIIHLARLGSEHTTLQHAVLSTKEIFDRMSQLQALSSLVPELENYTVMMQAFQHRMLRLPSTILFEMQSKSSEDLQKEMEGKISNVRDAIHQTQLNWWIAARFRVAAQTYQRIREQGLVQLQADQKIIAHYARQELEYFRVWKQKAEQEFKTQWMQGLRRKFLFQDAKDAQDNVLDSLIRIFGTGALGRQESKEAKEEERVECEDMECLVQETWFEKHSPKWRYVWNSIIAEYEDRAQTRWVKLLQNAMDRTGIQFPQYLRVGLRWVPGDEDRTWSALLLCNYIQKLVRMCVWYQKLARLLPK